MKNEYMKYAVVMVLCFLMGGFSIIFFAFQVYSDYWSSEVVGEFLNFSNVSENMNLENVSNFTRNGETNEYPPRMRAPVMALMDRMSSPLSLMLILNGIILIAGGISLWSLTKEKEIAHTKEKLTSLLLRPEEKMIIDELKRYGGAATQSHLVIKTGMNKVKVHRIIHKLEAKKIVSKHGYGLTNKIVLEKDFG